MKRLSNKGFTIVELLIASMVFATVLLICMDGITRIAKAYIKNTSVSKTNEFVKSFSNDIAQQIKYSSFIPTTSSTSGGYKICVNSIAYKITFNTTTNAILKKTDTNCGNFITNSTFFDSGSENFAPVGGRVLKFSVTPSNNIWKVNIKIALAEPDLLVDSSNRQYNSPGYDYATAKCRSPLSGNEFCSIIELNTSVSRRMR